MAVPPFFVNGWVITGLVGAMGTLAVYAPRDPLSFLVAGVFGVALLGALVILAVAQSGRFKLACMATTADPAPAVPEKPQAAISAAPPPLTMVPPPVPQPGPKQNWRDRFFRAGGRA